MGEGEGRGGQWGKDRVIFVLIVCFALLHFTFSVSGCFFKFYFHVSLAYLLIKEMD